MPDEHEKAAEEVKVKVSEKVKTKKVKPTYHHPSNELVGEDQSWDPAHGGSKPDHPIYTEGQLSETEKKEHKSSLEFYMTAAVVIVICGGVCLCLCCKYCQAD